MLSNATQHHRRWFRLYFQHNSTKTAGATDEMSSTRSPNPMPVQQHVRCLDQQRHSPLVLNLWILRLSPLVTAELHF